MSKRVATITLNPAYDLVGLTTDISIGKVNRVQTVGLYPAGKGISHVVISLGDEGAILVNASGTWLAKPPHCEIVSIDRQQLARMMAQVELTPLHTRSAKNNQKKEKSKKENSEKETL